MKAKIGKRHLHKLLVNICVFCENRCKEGRTVLAEVNTITVIMTTQGLITY